MNVKDKMYNYFVCTNGRVWYEYERYVREHLEEHRFHRMRHLKLLLKLNWFYRVKKNTSPYLYWDVPVDPTNKNEEDTVLNRNLGLEKVETEKKNTNFRMGNEDLYRPESTMVNQNAPHWLAMELLPYEIISFDVFDTLIFRPFDDPKVLFGIVGEKLGIKGFINIRTNSEKEAREKHFTQFGNYEVNIYEIYKVIQDKTGISVQTGVECECNCEIQLCYANPYMKQLFDILECQNKRIIILSDMYLPSDIVRNMLDKCGYKWYEHIFISNECQLSKSSGTIYAYILNELNIHPNEIIHVGDNDNGDIKQAEKNGIKARKYVNVNRFGKKYRPLNMSNFIGSAYRGIVNSKFYNGLNKYTHAYEYGYSVGGLYVLGYMNFVHQYAQKNNIDCLLFMARDGYIYKEVYDRMFPDNNEISHYFLWSRIASEFCNIQNTRESFLNTYINAKKNARFPTTVKDLFVSLGLEKLLPKLNTYHIKENAVICNENGMLLRNFFVTEWENVCDEVSEITKGLYRYINDSIKGASRIGVVDVGWTGNNVIKLRNVIRQIDQTTSVKIFLAGYNSVADEYEELKDNIIPYIFSKQKNVDIFLNHHKDKKPRNNLFEILTQAKTPTFYGIKNEKYIFDFPEIENYEQISDIHNGILDFVDNWTRIFEGCNYMDNISGADAYRPFEKRCMDYNWFAEVFGNFTVSMKTLSNSQTQKMETVRDIL